DLRGPAVGSVSGRLEERVREAEEQEVLHRLLPEIVVDAEDRRLVEDAMERRVQGPGRGQGAAERLLQDDPRALRAPGLAETLDDRGEEARRDREVVERP